MGIFDIYFFTDDYWFLSEWIILVIKFWEKVNRIFGQIQWIYQLGHSKKKKKAKGFKGQE